MSNSGYLGDLSQERQAKTYRASPVRRVMRPKADGGLHPLGIPTSETEWQMAVKRVIEPIFEADFCEHSEGFCPKKSAHPKSQRPHQ